jgi:hypothetical protein
LHEEAKEMLEFLKSKARKRVFKHNKWNIDKDESDDNDWDDNDSDVDDHTSDDNTNRYLKKDRNQIKKVAEGVEEKGDRYFEHCSKENEDILFLMRMQ